MKISLTILTIFQIQYAVNAYSYSKDAVYLLGDPCFSDGEGHDLVSDTDENNQRIVTVNVSPGKMCYFETFSSFKVGGEAELTEFEKDNLAVDYFPYKGTGADMYVNG